MVETGRWQLPLLDAGQAQKEMTVNEALTRLDLLAQSCVVAQGVITPPAQPAPGEAWIVGRAPEGVWAGYADAIAGWTEGGWRFVAPREGLSVWIAAESCSAAYTQGRWRVGVQSARAVQVGGVQVIGAQAPAVAAPVGGSVVDVEARAALSALLTAVRGHGLIAP